MKKWLVAIALSITCCYMSAPEVHAQEDVLISYHSSQDRQLIEEVLAMDAYESWVAVNTIKATLSSEKIAKLKALPIDVQIDSDEVISALSNTQTTSTLWNLKKLNISTAWLQNYTGKGVKIAVIDTGINNISALPHVKKRVSFVTDDPATTINEADHIDRGYNGQGHGTSVASIIAGQANGQSVMRGIAPEAELYALKYADGTKSGLASAIIKSINWAIEHKMDIINISSGLTTDVHALHQAVKNAHAKGIFIIASAGNDGQFNKARYPARYAEVISVGSINKYGDLSSFSNNMSGINFAAPGEEILALNQEGKSRTVNGTSFSAPHITGLLALYKERFPYSKPSSLLNYMKKSAASDFVPHFQAPAYQAIKDKVSVRKTKVTDHQVDLKLTYPSTAKNVQAVILLNNQIVGYTKASSYRLSNLRANSKQKIEVRLIDSIGNWSKATSLTIQTAKDTTAPDAPSKFQAKINTNGTVRLSWVQKKTGDFDKTLIYENGVKVASTASTTYQLNKVLKINKHYTYKLVTIDTTGNRSKAKKLTVTRYK